MKIKILTFGLAVCVVMSSCAVIPEAHPVTPLPIVSSTGVFTSTDTPLPPSQLTPQPTWTPDFLSSDILRLCPENRIVPIWELGMDLATKLLVLPESVENESIGDSNGLFSISPKIDAEPQIIPNLVHNGNINSVSYHVSPNGQWVVFNQKLKDDPDSDELATISSLDGQKQWSLSLNEKYKVGYWLDNTAVILFNQNDEPSVVIDPFTMEKEYLKNIPSLSQEGIGGIFFKHDNFTYLLYQVDDNYRLFVPSKQTDQQVLDWLSSSDTAIIDRFINVTSDGGIIIRVKTSYGFEISPEIKVDNLAEFQSYTDVMKQMRIPDNISSSDISFSFNSTSRIIWQKNEEKASLSAKSQFFIFNFEQQKLTDFCFEYKSTNLNSISISPDEKFVAFTFFHLPSTSPIPKSIVFLNLETGHMAEINGYRFVGWGNSN